MDIHLFVPTNIRVMFIIHIYLIPFALENIAATRVYTTTESTPSISVRISVL